MVEGELTRGLAKQPKKIVDRQLVINKKTSNEKLHKSFIF